MSRGRWMVVAAGACAVVLASCSGQPAVGGAAGVSGPSGGGGPVHQAAGITWTVPESWTPRPSRAMRVATYAIPAAPGAAPGSCAVYYFGRDRGGSVDANVARWAGQFAGGPTPVRVTQKIGGLEVTAVEIRGTYLEPGGPGMTSQGRMPDAELLGAIVEGPSGPVFFKCVGPMKTMRAARNAFDAMIGSVSRTP